LKKLTDEGGKDLKAKRYRLELHLAPFFGTMPLTGITSFDVERYKKSRLNQRATKSHVCGRTPTKKETNVSPGTVNRELAVLSHLLNKALEWGWIDRQPAKIRRLQEDAGRITYLTTEQIENLVKCAQADQNSQIYPFIVIAVNTSMRLMEVLSIRKENIDLERRVIYIPNAKAGPREQPITGHLCQFLSGYIEHSQPGTPWLFPSPGSKTGHTTTVRKPFRRVVSATDLNPNVVTPHTLRHTAITHLVQSGVDLPTVKRISGHKTLAMVERYAHANGEHIQAAMDKLQNRYQKAAAKGIKYDRGI
jgi:integrase